MYIPAPLQALAARAVRRVFVGDDLPIAANRDFGDPGYLGPDSISWQVLADPATVTGGVAALMMQAGHPLALQGVVDHSAYRQDPFGRLRRTVSYVLATSYGSKDEARAAANVVIRRHETVSGTTSRGEHYAASDERLMLWIHCALISCILASHQAFGRMPLSRSDADRFVAEQATLAALLGLCAPRTVQDLHETIESFREELRYDENTADALAFITNPPLPPQMRVAYGPVLAGATSVLDQKTASLLKLRKPSSRAVRPACYLYKAWRIVLPTNAVLQTALARVNR